MVEFDIQEDITSSLIGLIPDQRKVVKRLFISGHLISYALSQDRKKLWAVFSAETIDEVSKNISKFPIATFLEYVITPLMFNEMANFFPSMSLN